MRLYELAEKYQILQEMLEEGEIDKDILNDTLESLDADIEEKAENYAIIRANLEAEAKALKDEEQRLATRRRALENNASRLKSNLEYAMLQCGKKKFKTSKFSFNIQKNPPKVNILDAKQIPKEYLIPQDPAISTKGISDFLKDKYQSVLKQLKSSNISDEKVEEQAKIKMKKIFPWAELVQSESLRIR